MNTIFKPGLRAFLLGFAASLLFLAVNVLMTAIHHRYHRFPAGNLSGYLLIAAVLILSIIIAKLSHGRAWLHGLWAGIGFGLVQFVFALHSLSPHPSTWVWLLGWPMLWMYVVVVLALLLTSSWAQSAAFWFARRRIVAALVVAGSSALVVAIFAAGFALMRSHYARAQAIQSSAATQQVDIPLPSLVLTTMDGKPIPASGLQGRVTVIDFWGTWCGACIAEFPSLEAVHKEYSANPNVRFLLVNPEFEGDTPEKINRFLRRTPLSIPIALNPSGSYYELTEKLNNNMLPLLIVIDRHGHIRYRENGFDSTDKTKLELHTQVDTLLAAP